ncbi:MAG: NAD(P)/FAD-dependent oxidoreductase [Nitrosopumilus sp.]
MVLGKAVVIGGSIAGLLTARVLSDHFQKVILIERDRYEDNNNKVRKVIPQANHVHLLLAKGREILQDFFPEIEQDLVKNGANKIDFLNDGRYRLPSGWAQRFESGITTITCTRTLLENTIRRQVQKITSIIIKENTFITSFVLENSNKISLDTLDGKKIHADLIVDCTGRNTKMPSWLEDVGYPKSKETKVDSFVGYATRRYIPPKNFEKKWKMLMILNKPTTNPRAGVIYPIENGKWLAACQGLERIIPQ